MRQSMGDSPIAVVHEQQIEIIHSIVVFLMEEIVSGDACPYVNQCTHRRKQIVFEAQRQNSQQQRYGEQSVNVKLKATDI